MEKRGGAHKRPRQAQNILRSPLQVIQIRTQSIWTLGTRGNLNRFWSVY